MKNTFVAAVPLLLALAACADTGGGADETPAVHVDSVFPIAEEIRRFRADLPETPVELGPGAAPAVAVLIDRFVAAVGSRDTAVIRSLVVSRAEFAYLWYPYTRFTAPPYEMSPALIWFQLQQTSEKGIGRVLATYGGTPLELADYQCTEPGDADAGGNTLIDGCLLRLRGPDGGTVERRLFGAILARNGRFKFLSYANDL